MSENTNITFGKELDETKTLSLKSKPWVRETLEFLHEEQENNFLRWASLVTDLGENEIDVNQWLDIYKKQMQTTGIELAADVEVLKKRVVDKIEELMKKITQLTVDMGIKHHFDSYDNLSLYQLQTEMNNQLKNFQDMSQARYDELEKLRKKQLKLCGLLERPPRTTQTNALLSKENLDELRKYIETLETEKFEREERFLLLKSEIMDIANQLELRPDMQFEKDVLSMDVSMFPVSESNMVQLEKFHAKLEVKLKNVKENVAELREKLSELWVLLEVDMIRRDTFLKNHTGHSLDTLKALEKEVQRCEDLKKANIQVFVEKRRDELMDLWNQCHCDDSQKDQFSFFRADSYNEDLLLLHEMEIRRWKMYFKEAEPIINLVEKHKKLWDQMVQLEKNASGPNRFNNRGGNLLKEEKERNALAKKIPKLEAQLLTLAAEFENVKNTPFRTFGRTIEEYIAQVHSEREEEKKLKLSARKQQREQTQMHQTPSKSCLRLFAGSTTNLHTITTPRAKSPSATQFLAMRTPEPFSSTKRKIGATPLTENKRVKRTAETKKTPISSVAKLKRRSFERLQCRTRSAKKETNNKENAQENVNTTSDYNAFEKEISNRVDNCRSTLTSKELVNKLTPKRNGTPRRNVPKIKLNDQTHASPTPSKPGTPKLSRATSTLKLIF